MATQLYQCTLCDEQVQESGRTGHLKFTKGDGHGDHQSMPDEWDEDTEDFFAEVEGGNGSPTDTSEDTESGDDNDNDEGGNETPDKQPSGGGTEPSGSTTNDSPLARVKRFLTTPIKDL